MTGRSHPPALLRRTGRTLREETTLRGGEAVVVAVSGGGDSMALLHVMARLRLELDIALYAHGVDHGLREEAARELDLAAALADQLGVPFSRTRLTGLAGSNLQARAREARYAALDDAARRCGARWVATAHHADDRAETVLMRLLRGSRPEALAVLPACSERRLRPFIRSPRRAIASHLLRHGIACAEDPSNRDRRFLRARVRHELLPLMFELDPRIIDHLNQLADELADPAEICVTDEQGQPVPVRLGHRTQIRRALKLGQRHARIRLPGGMEVRMDTAGAAAGLRAVPRAAPRAADPKAAAALENAEVGRENGTRRRAKPVKSD